MNLLVLILTVYLRWPEKLGAPAMARGWRCWVVDVGDRFCSVPALGPYRAFTRLMRAEVEALVSGLEARSRSSGYV